MKARAFVFAVCACFSAAHAQTNILSTNPLAEKIMLGQYNPNDYKPAFPVSDAATISAAINSQVSPDSLKAYILGLASFYTRNTASDTVSAVRGVGAARRWIHGKFAQFGAGNQHRLIPSYLRFDQQLCSAGQHRNIFAVLPGSDTSDKRIILIEGHMDSRCESLCDTSCMARGVEDNATGSALVMELARVMSKFHFKNTIVFMCTIAEEQSLAGATAFSAYAKNKGIGIKAVQNNDVIGGIICGKTSSPPSCPSFNDIDSTQVRLFSSGGVNSAHKQYARFCKLQYKEMLLSKVKVPMLMSIMSAEDRTGRGGDHIPFRQAGYTAIRFTSANEHGDASAGPGYTDRQHSSTDVLGTDNNGDQVVDSFYVDFNYLARNTVINGIAAAMAALGPKTPDLSVQTFGKDLIVRIIKEMNYQTYRIAVRTLTHDWDSVYTFSGNTSDTIGVPTTGLHYVSVASVDGKGIESLFSREIVSTTSGVMGLSAKEERGIELLQNKPNPFDESTYINVWVPEGKVPNYSSSYILITDLNGKEIFKKPLVLHAGMNEILYEHGYGMTGIYNYSLVIDWETVATKRMIFAN